VFATAEWARVRPGLISRNPSIVYEVMEGREMGLISVGEANVSRGVSS
jgi:hypothetical protein